MAMEISIRKNCLAKKCPSITNRVCSHGYCPNHCMDVCKKDHNCSHK